MTNMPEHMDNSSFDSVKSNEDSLDDYYNIETNEKDDTKKVDGIARASEELFMTKGDLTTRTVDTKIQLEKKNYHTRA